MCELELKCGCLQTVCDMPEKHRMPWILINRRVWTQTRFWSDFCLIWWVCRLQRWATVRGHQTQKTQKERSNVRKHKHFFLFGAKKNIFSPPWVQISELLPSDICCLTCSLICVSATVTALRTHTEKIMDSPARGGGGAGGGASCSEEGGCT